MQTWKRLLAWLKPDTPKISAAAAVMSTRHTSSLPPPFIEKALLPNDYLSPLISPEPVIPANEKGKSFEDKVSTILKSLVATNPSKVMVQEHPRITLQNQEVVIPDFHLTVELAHELRHYLIECRDRDRDAKDILHKIRHMRDKQRWQTFLFLYPTLISPELARAFDAEGVMHLNLDAFMLFIRRLQAQLIIIEEALPILLAKDDLDQPKPQGARLSS